MATVPLKFTTTNNIAAFEASMARLERIGQQAAGRVGGAFRTLAGAPIAALGVAIAGAFAGRALMEGTGQIFEAGRALQVLQRQTGATTYGLAVLQAKFRQSGLDADLVGRSIFRLQKSIAGVEDEENKGGASRIQKLGLSLAQLQKMKPDQQFLAVGRAISAMADPAERTGAAMQIFGRTGAELGALFNGRSFGQITPNLARNAAILAQNSARFEQVSIRLQRVGDITKSFYLGVAERVSRALIPILDRLEQVNLVAIGERFGDALTRGAIATNEMLSSISQADLVSVGQGFATALKGAVDAVGGLGDMFKSDLKDIQAVASVIKEMGSRDPSDPKNSWRNFGGLGLNGDKAKNYTTLTPDTFIGGKWTKYGRHAVESYMRDLLNAPDLATQTTAARGKPENRLGIPSDPYYSSLNHRLETFAVNNRHETKYPIRPQTLPDPLLANRALSASSTPVTAPSIGNFFSNLLSGVFSSPVAAQRSETLSWMRTNADDPIDTVRQATMRAQHTIGIGGALDFDPSARAGWTGATNAFSNGMSVAPFRNQTGLSTGGLGGGAYGKTGNIWHQVSGMVGKPKDGIERTNSLLERIHSLTKENIELTRRVWEGGGSSGGGGTGATASGR